jgi:fatty-acid desaturase
MIGRLAALRQGPMTVLPSGESGHNMHHFDPVCARQRIR